MTVVRNMPTRNDGDDDDDDAHLLVEVWCCPALLHDRPFEGRSTAMQSCLSHPTVVRTNTLHEACP